MTEMVIGRPGRNPSGVDAIKEAAANRSCGTCFTCCVHLGIEVLKKWPGQSCKHLDGRNPEKRCSIYSKLSTVAPACPKYRCAWLQGLLADDARPDMSGLLVTPYAGETEDDPPNATILITDRKKCGTLEEGHLADVVQALLTLDFDDVRIINYQTGVVIRFFGGEIKEGKLLPAKSFEELNYVVYDPPAARYEVRNR
jgi:hypothetical protein